MKHTLFYIFLTLILTILSSRSDLLSQDTNGNIKISKSERWGSYFDESLTDSLRLHHLDRMIWDYYLFRKTDSALLLAEQAIKFQQNAEFDTKEGYNLILAGFHSVEGIANSLKGNQNIAIQKFEQGIENLGKTKREENFRATLLNNIGNVYSEIGDYPKAIDVYMQSLKIKEKFNVHEGVGNALNNIGNLYRAMDNTDRAIEFYQKAVNSFKKANHAIGVANSSFNIGFQFLREEEYDSAVYYMENSLEVYLEKEYMVGAASVYSAFAKIAREKDEIEKSIQLYNKTIDIYKEMNSKQNLASELAILSFVYLELGDLDQAEILAEEAYQLAKSLNNENAVNPIREVMFLLYKQKGKYREALDYYETFIHYRDSMKRDENKDKLNQKKYEYEYEKKVLRDSLERAERDKLTAEKLKSQSLKISQNRQRVVFLVVIIFLTLGSAFFIFRKLRQSQKQKAIIKEQKSKVEEQRNVLDVKNKEIMDSINYAKRLQNAILPSKVYFQENFEDHFIFYKPKDVVSGDFYWLERVGDSLFIAAADCTGHGVPGAMVSVVCSNALTKTVVEEGVYKPAEILNRTRDIVIEHFGKSGSGIYDGMDIALIKVDFHNEIKEGRKVTFAGANNPFWLVRNGELKEIKADKQPIGSFSELKPFNQHEVKVEKGDLVYLFSDGFQDQFGGEKADIGGKKFKVKNFKSLVVDNCNQPMTVQKETLVKTFKDWKKDLPQTDDIVIIGLKF